MKKKQCDATVAYQTEMCVIQCQTACHYTAVQSKEYKGNTIKCQDVSHSFVCAQTFFCRNIIPLHEYQRQLRFKSTEFRKILNQESFQSLVLQPRRLEEAGLTCQIRLTPDSLSLIKSISLTMVSLSNQNTILHGNKNEFLRISGNS